jgi:preprotein translocase subunit YajC
VEQFAQFLPLVAIALLFWVLVVRPASRRQKAVAQLQAELQPGQHVMMSSGIFGTVSSLEGDRARIEIAPGLVIEVARAAISVVDPPAPSSGPNELTDPTDEDR